MLDNTTILGINVRGLKKLDAQLLFQQNALVY
jgi:hypothetical protein